MNKVKSCSGSSIAGLIIGLDLVSASDFPHYIFDMWAKDYPTQKLNRGIGIWVQNAQPQYDCFLLVCIHKMHIYDDYLQIMHLGCLCAYNVDSNLIFSDFGNFAIIPHRCLLHLISFGSM